VFLLLHCFLLSNYAQKHDFNWIIGYGDFTVTEPNRNGLLLDFNGNILMAAPSIMKRVFSLKMGTLSMMLFSATLIRGQGILLTKE